MEAQLASNRRKTFALFAVVGLYMLLIPVVIFLFTDDWVFPSITFGVLILYILFRYFRALKSFIRLHKAIPANRNAHRSLYLAVENTAIRLGIATPKAYIISDPALNAFTAGSKPKNYIIGVTTGLLEKLDDKELEGVIAHEFGHIVNKDTQVNTLAFVFMLAFLFFLDLVRIMSFSSSSSRRGNNGLLILILFAMAVVGLIIAVCIRFAISRQREYLADATSVQITKYPEGLASALRKIASEGSALKKSSTMSSHLFLSNPNKFSFFSKLFASHPPIDDRIKQIEALGRSGY